MRDDRIEHRGDMLQRAVFPQGGPIPTEPDIEAWIARHLAARGITIKDAARRPVFVNDGRWVAECDCGAGLACSPGVPHATCPECGCHCDLDWPDEATRARIEQTLLERPSRLPRSIDPGGIIATRCWTPNQSIEYLEAETARGKLLHAAAKGVR